MGEEDSFYWVEEQSWGPCVSVGMKRKAKTRKMEFSGWGSRPLIEFLEFVGVDSSQPISQYDLTDIVNKHIKDHNLHHPTKKKRVVSDEWLLSLFGRKTVAKNKIYEMLGTHIADNQVDSDDDLLFSSEEDDDAGERQKNVTSERKTYNKRRVVDAPKSCFAAIIPDNIKLVYLKRSLVQDLLKKRETFESKIVGSFVRVKSDPHDYLQKNSHMLVQVTGLKKASNSDSNNGEIILRVSNFMKDVHISMLSDDNFLEEECEDLRRRISDGLLKRPTLVELEEKVHVLHADITNHWLVVELAMLQKLIDRANEKGWRRELLEYLDRRQLLQSPEEQSRLLQEVPEIITDGIEVKAASHDFRDNLEKANHSSPESTPNGINENFLNGGSNILGGATKGAKYTWISFNKNFADSRHDAVLKEQEKQPAQICFKDSIKFEAQNVQNVKFEAQNLQNANVEPQKVQNIKVKPQNVQNVKFKPQNMQNCKFEPKNVQTNSQCGKHIEVIDLSDDEDDEENANLVSETPSLVDVGSFIWHYRDPQGEVQGPFPLTILKRWNDADYFPANFKVWRTEQNQKDAVLLSNILGR